MIKNRLLGLPMHVCIRRNGFNKQVDTYNEPLLALQNFKWGVYGLLIIDIVIPVALDYTNKSNK